MWGARVVAAQPSLDTQRLEVASAIQRIVALATGLSSRYSNFEWGYIPTKPHTWR